MPSIEIEASKLEFDVYCECGRELECSVARAGSHGPVKGWYDKPRVIVEPCPDCQEKAKDEGYEQREEEEDTEIKNLKPALEAALNTAESYNKMLHEQDQED